MTAKNHTASAETPPAVDDASLKEIRPAATPADTGISPGYWDSIATGRLPHRVLNPVLDEHKKMTHQRLLAKWAEIVPQTTVLKTDLFEEATGPDQLLFDLSAVSRSAVGMDISNRIALRARQKAAATGAETVECVCCDVRRLPFKTNSFDLILSNSTLDHFPTEVEIIVSLKEFGRILRPGGSLILTLDNKNCLTYPPYYLMRLWMWLGFSPYFIGRTLSLREIRHASEEIGMDVAEATTIFHFPHPDILVKTIVRNLHKFSRGKLDGAIMRALLTLDRLEDTRIKFLTGRYIALKMVKKQ